MKRIPLIILVIGILLLGACGGPSEPANDEPESTEPEGSPSQPAGPILEFGELAGEDEPAKWENEMGRWKPATAIIDGEEKALTSQYFENTYVTVDDQDNVLLVFEWNEEGSQLCEAITSRLIGQPLALFEGDEALRGEDGQPFAPMVMGAIKDQGIISGLSLSAANELSARLNAGQ